MNWKIIFIWLSIMLITYLFSLNFIKIEGQELKHETQLDIINNLIQNVSSSHTYELDVFDCTEFSEEVLSGLKEINVNSICVFGSWYDSNVTRLKYHTWVQIGLENQTYNIEATEGRFFREGEIDIYKIISKGKCI